MEHNLSVSLDNARYGRCPLRSPTLLSHVLEGPIAVSVESGGPVVVDGGLEEESAAEGKRGTMIEIIRPAVEARPREGDVALVCLSWDVAARGRDE